MKRTEFKIAMLGNWPIFDDYIAFLEEQKRPEQALQVAQLARARTLAEQLGFKRQPVDAKVWVSRIQNMLRTRTAAILAYYESEHALYVWAITPKRLLPVKLEVTANQLETLADSYAREIQEHRSLQESVAEQRLYQILLKPVREVLPKGTHVILVADSALYRINLETLISDEGSLHYWIDDAELENASSIDLLLAGQSRRRSGKGLLLIGAPEQVSQDFPALPQAPEEMENVRKHFPPAEVKSFSGPFATPQAFIASAPEQYKFIELATHGTPSTSDPMGSSIILSRGMNGNFQLFARDITKLKLNADLVSISACYGAGTFKTSAEGLLGLQWAFMRAGAHQVVAGLWDVNDESVPRLMGGLYEGVVKGRSASASLRAAKLKMLHAGGPRSAPYYWAPLQVYTGP
jgi:CHAT domain-containing protein